MTLSHAILRENNNYNLIRLIAALMVVFGHSFRLYNSNGNHEPIENLIKYDYSGSLAVLIFFFISGIYITHSYYNSKTWYRFILMRVFRILPGLWVCIFITVFLIGPILTTSSIYFRSIKTHEYLFYNSLLIWGIKDRLPGVFISNYYPNAVNGSLWTLTVEVRCYGILFIAGLLGLYKRKIFIVFFFVLILIFHDNNFLIRVMTGSGTIKLLISFFAGSLAYVYREYVVIDYRIALFLIMVFLISYFIHFNLLIFYITLLYSVLTIGASRLFKSIHFSGDYSYGVYIYGFLVQQILSFYYPTLHSYQSLLLALPITLMMGILSWHLIEGRSIVFAKKVATKLEINN